MCFAVHGPHHVYELVLSLKFRNLKQIHSLNERGHFFVEHSSVEALDAYPFSLGQIVEDQSHHICVLERAINFGAQLRHYKNFHLIIQL